MPSDLWQAEPENPACREEFAQLFFTPWVSPPAAEIAYSATAVIYRVKENDHGES
jgi:hypothetical protein